MKCLNPKCPAPTFVETLPKGIKFCPICGTCLDSQQNENVSQTTQETVDQSSLSEQANECISELCSKEESWATDNVGNAPSKLTADNNKEEDQSILLDNNEIKKSDIPDDGSGGKVNEQNQQNTSSPGPSGVISRNSVSEPLVENCKNKNKPPLVTDGHLHIDNKANTFTEAMGSIVMPITDYTTKSNQKANNIHGNENGQDDKGVTHEQEERGVTHDQDDKGVIHDQGDKGVTHDQDEQGVTHGQGDKGVTHEQVEQGVTYDQDDKGVTHDQDDKGVTHDQGDKGVTHDQDEQGVTHDQGDKGVTHEQDEQGVTRDQDEQGVTHDDQDEQGVTHDQDDKGVTHVQDDKGVTHDQDEQGVTHDQDEQGVTHDQGDNGVTHDQGDKGVTHDQDEQGVTRDQDEQGVTHDQDEQGVTHVQDDKGVTHVQDDKGVTHDQDEQGVTHDQDDKGVTHDQDDKGVTHDQDDKGVTHDQDDKGVTHDPDERGVTHEQGDKGVTHEQGDKGVTHDPDEQGVTHEQGDKNFKEAEDKQDAKYTKELRVNKGTKNAKDDKDSKFNRETKTSKQGKSEIDEKEAKKTRGNKGSDNLVSTSKDSSHTQNLPENGQQPGMYYRKPHLTDEHNKPNKQKSKNANMNTNKESFQGTTSKGKQSQDNYMTIVLHALLAPHFQFDPTKGDKIVVRGETPNFDGWKKDKLQMKIIRPLPEGYILIEGSTTILLNHASKGINYKYIVIKQDDDKEMWEELVDCQDKYRVNRCFRIPERYRKPKGVWHQYDDAVFSQPKFWESIRNRFPYMKAMNPYEGRELAIQAMLPDWDSFGVEETSNKKRGNEVLETINQVIYCMENAKAEKNGSTWYRTLNGFSLEQVMLSYFDPRLKKNYELAHSTNDEHIQANRLASSLAIAAIASNFIRKRSFHPTEEHLKAMFECLAINASIGKQRLQSIMEILAQHYPRNSIKILPGAISEVCQLAVNYYPDVHEWLLAVPLMHFLSNVSQPYTNVPPLPESTRPDTSYWGTNGLDLTEIQTTLWRSPIGFLHRLKPMFKFDLLLRRTFLFALPLSHLGRYVEQGDFLPHEVSWTLARMLQKHTNFYYPEELSSINICFKVMIHVISLDVEKDENQKSELIHNNDELMSLARGSLQVLERLLIPLKDTFGLACDALNLLSKSLSLIKSTSTMSVTSSSDKNEVDQTGNSNVYCAQIFKESIAKVQNSLSKTFTGHSKWSYEWYIDEELKVWSAFLHVRFSDDGLQTCWQTVLLKGLKGRINKMDEMQKIDFYSKVNLSHYHEDIEKCFQEAAFDAITTIIKSGRGAAHAEAFNSLTRHDPNSIQSKRIGEMMSLLLNRCWPPDNEQENSLLNHVLTWSPMANYMRYFSQSSLTLPEDSQILLLRTTTCVEGIDRALSDGTITINTLRILRCNTEKYYELAGILQLSSADDVKEENEDEEDEKNEDAGKRCNRSKRVLQKRLNELEAFEEEQAQLHSFLNMSSILQHVDVENLKAKAKEKVSCVSIEEIAVRTQNEEIQVIFFGLSNELKSMVKLMYQIHKSEIFNDIWNNKFKDAQHDDQTMALEDVAELVWSPTYRKCSEILKAVLKGDITLADVDKCFGSFKDRCDELVKDLAIIMGVCDSSVDNELIQRQVNQIEQYHRLTECIAAANKILEFKEQMDLKGDFEMVNTFRQQISPKSKKQPLSSLQERFQDTGESLEKLTHQRLKCLDAVMESKEFIEWLRKEVPDSSEIKVLVDLAMMSAGEGDIESDRIAALHTCTRAFKPLIYDLNVEHGFDDLMKLCEDIWDALEHNPRLPQQMLDTSRRLEWLKNVKEFHGSVAMTSLQQVETINKHGILTIGCHGNSEEIDINTVISLKVPKDKVKGLQKETYNLEDLKDLQSKLMLIAGKSTGGKGKEDVEKFTEVLQGAIRLGTIYLNLCETGEVSHLNWKEDFHCKKSDVAGDLQSNHGELEKYFKAWIEVLNSQRKQCKELNYFTAKQLLYMRKEIAELRRGREFVSLHVQLYTLLDSVLPGVNALSLQEALIAIGIDVDFPQENELSKMEEDEEESEDEADLRKRYKKFFQNIEELEDYPEELALAAIVACDCPNDESDLIMWCLRYRNNEDFIQEMCDKGANNPKYASLFPKVTEPDISEPSSLDLSRSETVEDDDDYVAKLDQTVDGVYLSLEELSTLLNCLANHEEYGKQMKFPGYLKTGRPNLLLVPQKDILATVLGLYMESESLPSRHEVLICTKEMTLEEVELLWRRVLANTNGMFYCLVNADVLSYGVSQQAIQRFHKLTDEYNEEGYKLVVICSSEQEVRSHMVSALDKHRVGGAPRCPRPSEVTKYLQQQFRAPKAKTVRFGSHKIDWIPAAEVDSENRLSIRVISSHRAGTGKSLIVRDFSKTLDQVTNNERVSRFLEEKGEHVTPYVIIPLHGKTANVSDTVSFLLPYSLKSDIPVSRIFHFDISPSVECGLDTLLFNLLILGSIQDRRGRVWMRNPRDLYIVEVTSSLDNRIMASPGFARSNHFYEELPHVTCMTPNKTFEVMNKHSATERHVTLFNEGQFKSEAVQRVFQYLRLFDCEPEMLHEFQFDPEILAEGDAQCLCLLMRYCGVQDPSWADLQHFIDFLNYQLTDCELSGFCQMENVGDTLEGFRLFVVRFMTIMAQDFSTRSLGLPVSSENDDETEDQRDIIQFQLRRKWESSPHPYIFFNPDHETFTFLGFRIDLDGNLINSSTGEIIEEGLMTKHLRTGLHVQRVDFDENFEELNKADKINKICRVLGVEWPRDPDESYELTEDNAKKILAIHMRFRCGIPVVVMGETGCGKTKLIRYLCGLQKGFDERKNMLLVKVHGGTTFQDIENKVNQAKEMAKENFKSKIETVLFFDEVNTTEALDLVKEIMVDRRMNGRPLGTEDGLRFIAACNPYRKHTDSMIDKLESAGLGYSVKTEDTSERLGRVPLRHLVYRVHALPDSMRSLIWDFGQLKPEVEVLYTRQIVMRHVIKEQRIPGDESLVDAITSVLAESQRYMRDQSDECSFVSLRDVERTMNVMVWFYEHREVFQPLLEEIAKEENETTYGRGDSGSVNDHTNSDNDDDDDDNDEDDDNSDDHDDKEEDIHIYKGTQDTLIKESKSPFPYFFSGIKSISRSCDVAVHSKDIPSTSGALFPASYPPVYGTGDDLTNRPFTSMTRPDEDLPFVDEIPSRPEMFSVDIEEEEEEDLHNPMRAIDPVTWSLILAIGVCYHSKLQDREQYRDAVARAFKRPCVLYGGAVRILQEITRCQKAVLKELKLGTNIARNTALSENVFMMVVCIELRIPLFVIGKPGSSKSLAKTVVADNMQGDASKSKLFKNFKEVQMSAHQCSPLSTPEGIQETFKQCATLQKDKNPDKFVSVVVLDEVGLAEDSPLMPLKTLHPLLEDGVTSSDDIIEADEKPTRVAFIGISNWALDPAKMNRGIMLSRDVPDNKELIDSAMGICGTNKEVQERMEPIIPALADAYFELYKQQKEIEVLKSAKKDEFFGLRDFYSLVKMLYGIAKWKTLVPDWKDVEYAVRRNFGGLDVNELDPVEIFMKHLDVPQHVREEEENQVRKVSPLNLIKSSLDQDPSEENSRYLLILTENHAALGIVEQHLKQKQDELADAVLIFGSSFPKDLEYTQVCRNINDIKVCMETGRTVILLNMESLYEGLYDALNQYYVEFGGNQYVDLGLGTHRVKCRVHNQFRLIVIAEKDTVYQKFPIPLINRLEKHFLVLSTSLTKPQEQLVKTLRDWVDRFAKIKTPSHFGKKRKFTKDDAFVGYHGDTIPSVVLKVCGELQEDGTNVFGDVKDDWEVKVLSEAKRLLVQCCPPDAIIRVHSSGLSSEADNLWDLYFQQQQHSSLASFLSKVDRSQQHQDGLLIQVSTHSRLLSEQNMDEIAQAMGLHHHAISCITLQQFQTEQQFCDCVATFFARRGGAEGLLIVQCNPEDLTFNLLACARHHLLKQRSKIREELGEPVEPIHIIVIIQLPRMLGGYPNFVGFQGQRWESVHIDELFTPSFYVPSLEKIKDQSLSDLFEASMELCFSKNEEPYQVLDAVDVLRQSVQAAAGRIEDGFETVTRATKRIVILLNLLSKDMREEHEHDVNSFSHALICRVHQLLKEKDSQAPNEGTKWAISQALESSGLQESGTYRKALWRRIQNAVVPILSELIAYMDRDGNLELLQTGIPWLTELWIKIFSDEQLTELNYDSFFKTTEDDRQVRSQVPVMSSGRDSHFFQCRFPFSWLLKEKVESMWIQVKAMEENSNDSIEESLRRIMASSDVDDVVKIAESSQEAMERYIYDFVHMNCKPAVDGEDELIARALVVGARQQVSSHDEEFMYPDISLVHKIYARIDQRIVNFSQLVGCKPDIVPRLLEIFTPNETEMTLDAIALQMCLESLEPLEMNFDNHKDRKIWCDQVIAVRAAAERMLGREKAGKSLYELDGEEKTQQIVDLCRPLWERLTAVRLFIEHLYLSTTTSGTGKKSGSKKKQLDTGNITKLCKVLDDRTDFSSSSSIKAVELFLVETFTRSSAHVVNEFRHQCNAFFMELISLLCFGDRKSLEPEVFETFMRYITGSSSSQATKNFFPFPDFEVDKSPVVRSFLLQQLLTINFVDAKKYLQHYLSEARQLSPNRDHVIRVCQLAVDCIEESNESSLSQSEMPLTLLIGLSVNMIVKGFEVLHEVMYSVKLDIDALEGIARVRYVMSFTAELLFKSYVANDEKLQEPEVKIEFDKLLIVVEDMCSKMTDRAPLVYLLKQLTRRYGGAVIKDLTQNQQMKWLIPREFEERQMDTSSGPDRFVVYKEAYMSVRDALARGLLSGSTDDLSTVIQMDEAAMMKDVLCLLSIYREITCGYRDPTNKLTEREDLHKFLNENLSPEVRQLALQLLNNSHGMGFTALSVQPAQPAATVNLAEVVVHAMIVLQCSNDNDVTITLRTLLNNPANMTNSYFPTMPEDDFQQVRRGLTENVKWYQCPKGHRYSIGDCGNANQESVCPECKSGIGGQAYKLLPGNAPLTDQTEDRSSRGHILGNANMSSVVQSQRNLSPAAVHLIRMIMHSAMLVGGCRHPEESCLLFSPAVEPERLNEFLWAHLTRDLRSLAAALNRSEDEALLTIHLLMAQITRVTVHDYSLLPGSGVLNTPEARRQWEDDFTSSFIDPVLSTLDEGLQKCFDVMTNDNRVGTDPLMREIYEVDSIERDTEELNPMNRCFWRYRSKITVEHAKQRYSEQMKSNKKIQQCKVLQHFFKEEYRLRAVRYLPDINKLHKFLMERFFRRISQKEASEMTVKKFESNLKDSKKKEFKTLFNSFKAAWRMVRQELNKGRFKLSSDVCSMNIDDNSPLLVLLPSSDEESLGRCSMALLFYLATAHNEFMETYLNITVGSARDVNGIRLPEVTCSQLVSYDVERELLPLIHAHCHYSLKVGHGTMVEYDWPAIQRQLIDRFIRGKLLVDFQGPEFIFLRNNDEEMFIGVHKKIDQENISLASANTIMADLRQLDVVCDVKRSLEIAMGFLASSGGRPEQLISEYLHDVLRMPIEMGLRSRRADQHCQLRHITHLWQLVATKKAKILLRDGQDPFEDLQECFKEEIPRTVLTHLNKSLREIDCSKFSVELLEMITFSLNEENTTHVNESLKEFFEWRTDGNGTDISEIPEDLLLKHSVKTWENVLEKSEERPASRRTP